MIYHSQITYNGKAKEQFEKWIMKSMNDTSYPSAYRSYIDWLYDLPQSMQWGVIQDFADSLGIRLDVCAEYTLQIDYNKFLYKIHSHKVVDLPYYPYKESQYEDLESCAGFPTRQEARNAAIKKLNELINEK